LLERCDIVLGPYGGGAARAVARSHGQAPLWNHGAAADDVQRLPGVVSTPSPASRYLVAVARALAALHPACAVAIATARGGFAERARRGLEAEAPALGIVLKGLFSLGDAPARVAAGSPDAVLLCGPIEQELPLLRELRRSLPGIPLGAVSAGLRAFPAQLGVDPDGILAPVQWHPDSAPPPELGPGVAAVLADARALRLGDIDYVAAQAYACALIAARCLELSPADPLAAAAALRTTTFFGAFALDPVSGMQEAHRLSVVRWQRERQELLLADAA
jgi:hypothetical protein